jgi:hypothetical protein
MACIQNTECILPFMPIPAEVTACDALIYDYEIVEPSDRDVFGGIRLQFKVMTGYCTGIVFWRFFRKKFLWNMARQLGWGYRNKWSGNPADFVLTALNVRVYYNEKHEITFDKFCVESRHKTHNTNLRKSRSEPCVRNYPWTCQKCPVGHNLENVDGCFRATRAVSYPRRICANNPNGVSLAVLDRSARHIGFFKPGEIEDVCIECRVGLPINMESK